MRRLPPAAITALVFLIGFALCATQFPNFASTRVVANLFTASGVSGQCGETNTRREFA